jgi:CRP-like cAMP-binding protein
LNPAQILPLLQQVPFLSGLDDAVLTRLIAGSKRVQYSPRQCLVSELESGADVYVILSGEAEVSVDARDGHRSVLQKLRPGCAFGEMSSLTGALRSATVSALTDVEALVIGDADFDRLRDERPQVAMKLVRELAARLHTAEDSLESLLLEQPDSVSQTATEARARSEKGTRGSIGRAWRELVVARRQDCAFLTLAAFVVTLVAVRAVVYVAFHVESMPRDLFRALYVSGFALVAGSACTSLLTFRPAWRRWIAAAYGVGTALILNELGVTLAFDIFYKDIHTADPNVAFDLERLYRRAEPVRAITIGLLVLVQAAYLRHFYSRAAFVILTRLRRLRK